MRGERWSETSVSQAPPCVASLMASVLHIGLQRIETQRMSRQGIVSAMELASLRSKLQELEAGGAAKKQRTGQSSARAYK